MSNDFYTGEISPWARPRGVIPAMARYQAFTGLKPVGPHRSLADTLLHDLTRPCATCGGTGLHGSYGSLGWLACPECHGLGATWRISLDEVQARRMQVLERFPDAAAPGWRPGHPIRCPVQDLATGLILDACPQREDDPVQLELPIDSAAVRVAGARGGRP
jgi:hypothetical protein